MNTVSFSQFSHALPAAMLTKYIWHSILREHLLDKYFRTLKQVDSNFDRIKIFTRVWPVYNRHITVFFILHISTLTLL